MNKGDISGIKETKVDVPCRELPWFGEFKDGCARFFFFFTKHLSDLFRVEVGGSRQKWCLPGKTHNHSAALNIINNISRSNRQTLPSSYFLRTTFLLFVCLFVAVSGAFVVRAATMVAKIAACLNR